MPSAQKDDITEKRKNGRILNSPYNQSGRQAKMSSLRGWTPSIWNVLTFWRSDAASKEEDEDPEEDMSSETNNTHNSPAHSETAPNILEDHEHDTSQYSSGNQSEDMVSAQLLPQRTVRFQLPIGSQERSNARHSQLVLPSQPVPHRSVRQHPHKSYTAPFPPSSPFHYSRSPYQDSLSQVSQYIDGVLRPRGDGCSNVEALGLTMMIHNAVNQHTDNAIQPGPLPNINPFLLSTSNLTSPSSSPSSSPIQPTFTRPDTDLTAFLASSSGSPLAASTSNPPSPSTSISGRSLDRNPNGGIYYQGGGSARSRYRSPAFGTPPGRKKTMFPRAFGEGKKDTPKVNGVSETPSPSDGKRRRVGEDKDSSMPQASGSAHTNGISTPPRAPAATNLRFGMSSPASRFMASTPVRPSPLRQSVRADSSSPASSTGGSPRSRLSDNGGDGRSRASEIMAGIINDATPKKDSIPDVRNPYQPSSRSPTKRSRKIPAKAPRPPPRPTRQNSATSSSTTQPKKLSALETIQRTAPQAQTGSKRSHSGIPPPAAPNGISKRIIAGQPGSSVDKPFVIEVEDDEELGKPPAKRQKPEKPREETCTNPTNPEQKQQAPIDVDDIDMDDTLPDKIDRPSEIIEPGAESQPSQHQEPKRPVFPGFSKKGVATRFQTAPKEPSPLRQMFQPDTPPNSPPKSSTATDSVSFAKSGFIPTASVSSPFKQAPVTSPFAPTSVSIPATVPAPFAPTSTPSDPVDSPPATVTLSVDHSSPTDKTTDWLALAKKQVLEVPVHSLPTFTFAFTSDTSFLSEYAVQRDAVLAVPTTELPKFDFTANPAPTPAPPSPPKKEVVAFNWEAAGLKPKVSRGWICGTCGTDNLVTSSTCCACTADKP